MNYNSEIRHGLTVNTITSIEGILAVIEKDEVIDDYLKNKSGQLYRITVVAPITIADTPYYMAVMLQRTPQIKICICMMQ